MEVDSISDYRLRLFGLTWAYFVELLWFANTKEVS
jgi:hypothetical protein